MARPQAVPDRSPSVAVTLDELARRGRALPVLALLATEESINMSQFTRATKLVPDRAKQLRLDLEGFGLIDVAVVRSQGAAEILDIRLTALGREVAEHVVAIREALEAKPAPKGSRKR